MNRILIVEDDNDINSLLYDLLAGQYEVVQAYSGTEAERLLQQERFDLCLLDLTLPGMSGEEVLSRLRRHTNLPLIVITAKSDVKTLVNVLELGANDYIAKPFDTEEVKARIKTRLRIAASGQNSDKTSDIADTKQSLCLQGIELNEESRSCRAGGEEIALTQKEFDMLALFMKKPGRVYSKSMLYESVWGEAWFGDDNTINVHISRLRGKLKKALHKDPIQTVWGVGFRFIN